MSLERGRALTPARVVRRDLSTGVFYLLDRALMLKLGDLGLQGQDLGLKAVNQAQMIFLLPVIVCFAKYYEVKIR